jgi:hypothetical protein
MEQAAVRRARSLRAWATCAPRFVRREIDGILRCADLTARDRARIESWLVGLELGEPGTWVSRFPALAGADAPARLEGGLLSIVATDPGVLPPRGASSATSVLDLGAVGPVVDVHVLGLPAHDGVLVVGRSGGAAAWLAQRSRATGRIVPKDVVVSAELVPGPDGEPCLAAVAGGGAKARVVARELPGARLLLCGDPEGEEVVPLTVGARVRELERLVWGDAAIVDRDELRRIGALARSAFDAHDYATAESRYREVASASESEDVELHHEACLRLAAVAIHQGLPGDSDGWLRRADELERVLPRSKRGVYVVERLGTLAGRAIDGFRPQEARKLLETSPARHAAADAADIWKQIQVRGAWRRLHLLEGAPREAREEQRALVEITADDPVECPRVLLDLGFVETRCGDLPAARGAFLAAHQAIAGMPPVYALQSRAFLAWHLARFARRGGDLAGLGDLLSARGLDELLGDVRLQTAGRWRVKVVRAATNECLEALAAELTPFQRWCLGVFLLDLPATMDLAGRLLATADVDLSGMPVLERAREELRAGRLDPAVFVTHGAY